MVIPEVPGVTLMPVPLAETRLPAPEDVPPITELFESVTSMPASELPNPVVPDTSVPIKFPCTMLDCASFRLMPMVWPEMTLRAAAVAPPIVFPVQLKMFNAMRLSWFELKAPPIGVMPM
jgi:hypothetical protein